MPAIARKQHSRPHPPANPPDGHPPRYDRGAMALHWGHAALVLGLLGLGLYMVDLPKGAGRSSAIAWHKSFGILALLLVAARIAWRRLHPPPEDARLDGTQRRLADAGHRLLCLLLVLTPLAGYLSSSFTKYPMRAFGLSIPKAGWPDEAINAFFNGAHAVLAWSLAALIAAHIAAVVLHALQGRTVLHRMLPGHRPD
nr:cytochrome b/b6 domain-containing protein [Thauera sedimentorum]